MDLPEQTALLPVIEQVATWFTVKDLLELLVHPLASVTVTVKVLAVLTVIHCVVDPVFHKYPESPAGAHHWVAPPEQTELFPEIVEEGSGLTVSVFEPLPVHPFASVTVTVNEFAVPTVIHCVVAPVLHK